MIEPADRESFDAIVEEVIDQLPGVYRRQLDAIPVIVLDRPDANMLADLEIDPTDEHEILGLCGLHSGAALTERSVEDSGELPAAIHIFREGILELAGGVGGDGPEATLREQIRITILHELGHQFGLEEDDLYDLGYD